MTERNDIQDSRVVCGSSCIIGDKQITYIMLELHRSEIFSHPADTMTYYTYILVEQKLYSNTETEAAGATAIPVFPSHSPSTSPSPFPSHLHSLPVNAAVIHDIASDRETAALFFELTAKGCVTIDTIYDIADDFTAAVNS